MTQTKIAQRQLSPVENVLKIGAGLDFPTIMEAMAAITDASISKIYTLELYPSYKRAPNLWDTFAWKPFVQVVPIGNWNHKIPVHIYPDEGIPYAFDKAFYGIDFTDSGSSDWNPFPPYSAGMVICPLDSYYIVLNSEAGYEDYVGYTFQGAFALVKNSSGFYRLRTLISNDVANPADWIDVTPMFASMKIVVTDFSFSDFYGANLNLVSFYGCKMSRTLFNYARMDNCSFHNTDLSNSGFNFARINGLFIFDSILRNLDFNQSISNFFLSKSDASGSNFTGCTITQFDANQTDFSKASFAGSVLIAAQLNNNIFYKSDFANATLTNSVFVNASLERANLLNANITGTDFRGADLSKAILPANANTKATFKTKVGANKWDAVTTIWTDGLPIG